MPSPPEETTDDSRTLYRDFLAEREEILKHKLIKSEEAGHDIGFETALVDWSRNFREKWKKDFLSKPRD